ncbi:hypothetical protein DAPPUDRAFT_301806 [Daphnia pulex]|uniref:Uncharacterized protein n=1 Tax=Daphnia pulex TaxID=6669 RepID=E9HKN4_DAPPU|nr:hypothetical protein DAPPUDRAFT_301806 [Daphnia pulex]|eukprot:EFX67705.1 hypothetical protein DAPPUDRAFT_301806 [Daphnia pulex]
MDSMESMRKYGKCSLSMRFQKLACNKFFMKMSTWAEPGKEDPNESVEKRRSDLTRSPIDEWISALRESVEVQQSEFIPSVMLKWIALFEEHPKPSSCGGVDYKAIYLYLSSLSEGNIPPQLNPQSALKLMEMFDEFRASACGVSQELLRKTAKLAAVVQPIQRDEKNQLLRDKRRTEWTEEEKELRTLVQSGDLDGIMKVYCDQTGVNPFKFPPRV